MTSDYRVPSLDEGCAVPSDSFLDLTIEVGDWNYWAARHKRRVWLQVVGALFGGEWKYGRALDFAAAKRPVKYMSRSPENVRDLVAHERALTLAKRRAALAEQRIAANAARCAAVPEGLTSDDGARCE